MTHLLEVREKKPKGNSLWFNISQIVAMEAHNDSGTIIHANGRTYEIEESLEIMKDRFELKGFTVSSQS